MRAGQPLRELSVELGDVGHPAADDEDVRVERVDHDGQPAGQPVEVAVPDQPGEPVPGADGGHHLTGGDGHRLGQVDLGVPQVVLGEGPTGDPALQAAVLAAVAGRTRDLA